MLEHAESVNPGHWGGTVLSLTGIAAFLALFVTVGADCYWLVALGEHILDTGGVPEGLPFAEAPTADWHNVLVLAELVMALGHSLGPWALPLAQILAAVGGLALLAAGARRRGASDVATAVVLMLVATGSLASMAIVRLQIFSLVLFPLLLLLLRAQHKSPDRRIWWLPALVVLWTNLHGAVLLGVCVAGCYLLFSRLPARPAETVAVGVSTLLALLVTPAGWNTLHYYLGVMENEAAARGEGLWAPLDAGNPFDVLMIVAGLVLLVAALRLRLPWWEYAVLAGLMVGTMLAARQGIWLLMTMAAPAAVGLTRRRKRSGGTLTRRFAALLLVPPAFVEAVLVIGRGEAVLPADPDLVEAVTEEAGDRVVLAPEPLAESLAVEGVRVWAADPIDAFRIEDQRAFLDFLEGSAGMDRAVDESQAVVVEDGTDAAERMATAPGFTSQPLPGDWTLHLRLTGS